MIVRLPLEPRAVEFKQGRWRAELATPSKRFRGRAVWVGPTTFFAEEVAIDNAEKMLRWLERQTWMGGDV